jgi:ring-1,2-phenylacetyl-CoA epoxidase subunit PaaD
MARASVSVESAVRAVPDPEIPVITIDDLGIVRGVEVDESARRVVVRLTPTYSGCPAMEAIADHIGSVAASLGYAVQVDTVLSPPWTTDWISERGRTALREFGIAPPGAVGAGSGRGPVVVAVSLRQVACPRCGSVDTEELAAFGSTACKALRRCRSCREPFDEFKPL